MNTAQLAEHCLHSKSNINTSSSILEDEFRTATISSIHLQRLFPSFLKKKNDRQDEISPNFPFVLYGYSSIAV